MRALTDEQLLAAFNSCDKVIDGLHAVAELAAGMDATGFAGVRVWVGESSVTKQLTETEIKNERLPGQAIRNAAQECLAMLDTPAGGDHV